MEPILILCLFKGETERKKKRRRGKTRRSSLLSSFFPLFSLKKGGRGGGKGREKKERKPASFLINSLFLFTEGRRRKNKRVERDVPVFTASEGKRGKKIRGRR